MTQNLEIYLSSWIIADGNYDEFSVGETRKFALEFWASSPLTRATENVASLREQTGHSYDVASRLYLPLVGSGSLIAVCSPIQNRSAG